MRCVPALAALLACSPPATGPRAEVHVEAESPVRLVVLVVVDQWPEWAFETKRPELHAGFQRLLAEGEWHLGRYPSAAALTGPDHALLGTGAPPAISGIVADEWWHRDSRMLLESVHDEDGAITPKWLRARGLGDLLAAAGRDAKAVAVALKPRAALLPLGHHGVSIWYDAGQIAWTSLAPPPWLAEWNASHPIAAHLRDVWAPLDADRVAKLAGGPDDAPGEVGADGLGPTFPHSPATARSPGLALRALPVANDLVIDTATHAIDAEQLGKHHATDLLVISLSAYDYAGHGWGQESWEMWDMTLRLDARLDQLLADLDRAVGAGKWSMVVTSDHGASPLPERLHGGRLTHDQIRIAANNAATAVLGEGTWIEDAHYPNVYLSRAMLAQPKDELDSATKRVINALRSFPGLERVERSAPLEGRCETRTGDDRAVCWMLDPERSGELFFLPANGWILESEDEPAATAHGSLHDYDRLVPVIELGPERTWHAPAAQPDGRELDMVEIQPTLARWLGVPRS
jgi:hypothetical protein